MKKQIIILPYTAGLMDGEGSIFIGVIKPSIKYQKKSPNHYLQIEITNTNKEIINWLHQMFGGHISNSSSCPSRKDRNPCYGWVIQSNKAQEFLKLIYPFLKIKKKQAKLAIEFQEIRKGQTNKPPTKEQLNERDYYKQEISKFSTRKYPS